MARPFAPRKTRGKAHGQAQLSESAVATYVIAATLMILKAVSMTWLTVARMIKVNGGFRSPEDIRKTPFNPHPDPKQLERNEYVDRVRRIHQNDIENIPIFPWRPSCTF